jgi:hypothetical protein
VWWPSPVEASVAVSEVYYEEVAQIIEENGFHLPITLQIFDSHISWVQKGQPRCVGLADITHVHLNDEETFQIVTPKKWYIFWTKGAKEWVDRIKWCLDSSKEEKVLVRIATKRSTDTQQTIPTPVLSFRSLFGRLWGVDVTMKIVEWRIERRQTPFIRWMITPGRVIQLSVTSFPQQCPLFPGPLVACGGMLCVIIGSCVVTIALLSTGEGGEIGGYYFDEQRRPRNMITSAVRVENDGVLEVWMGNMEGGVSAWSSSTKKLRCVCDWAGLSVTAICLFTNEVWECILS